MDAVHHTWVSYPLDTWHPWSYGVSRRHGSFNLYNRNESGTHVHVIEIRYGGSSYFGGAYGLVLRGEVRTA